jgi:hypothetical protein
MTQMDAHMADAGVQPSAVARDACALACAPLVYLASAGRLFFWAPVPQLAFLCGMVAGLLASRWEWAAVAGAAAIAVGWTLGPPVGGAGQLARGDVASMLVCVAGAALVAVAARLGTSAFGGRFTRVASIALVAFVIANLWATAFGFNAQGPSVPSVMEQRAVPGTPWADESTYLEVYHRMREGQGYYSASAGVFRDDALFTEGGPTSVLNVRPPALQWALHLIAPTTSLVFYDLLILSSLAIAAAAVLAGTLVRRQFAIVAAVPVATCFLLVPGHNVLYSESWAVALVLISLGALVYAVAHERWRAAFVVGVIAALMAGAVREFCLIVPVAGFAASWVAPQKRRGFQKIAWILGGGALAVYYAAHVMAASGILVHGGGSAVGAGWWFSPSASNLLEAIGYFTPGFGLLGWFVYLIAIGGVAGVAAAPRGQVRVLLSVVVGALVVAFTVFRAHAFTLGGQAGSLNYWGILLVPLLAACMPVAFALVPGMRGYPGEGLPAEKPVPDPEDGGR